MKNWLRKNYTIDLNFFKNLLYQKNRGLISKLKEAKNTAALAKSETHFDGVLLSKISNVLIKISKDYSSKSHLHDKINVINNHGNSNTKKKKLNETYRMNNLTDYSVHNK